MAFRFPLLVAPICPSCRNSSTRDITSPSKRNGNAGRPYYYCNYGHARIFVTWDDSRGIMASNPLCECKYPSRRDRTNGPFPSEWYSCGTKECGFRQNIEPDKTSAEKANLSSNSQPTTHSNDYPSSPMPAGRVTDFGISTHSHTAGRSDLRSEAPIPIPIAVARTVVDVEPLDARMSSAAITKAKPEESKLSVGTTFQQSRRVPRTRCEIHGSGRTSIFRLCFRRPRCSCSGWEGKYEL